MNADEKPQGRPVPDEDGTARHEDTPPTPRPGESGSGQRGDGEGKATEPTDQDTDPDTDQEQDQGQDTDQDTDSDSNPAPSPAPVADPRSDSASASDDPPAVTGRQRLVAALWPPRLSRAQLIVALLLFTLGLGLAIQVRSTNDESRLRGARQEDLVRILDELDSRSQRLQDEKGELEDQRTELENSSDQAEEARRQTEKKADQLAVLAGSVAAQGPGITLSIRDPGGHVRADMLLDTLQELRAAGAEAIQINDVRVVADTFFSDDLKSGGVEIDGRKVAQPYRFKVIGNPQDLEPALNIPGGVVQSFEKEQASVDVVRDKKIIVDALRQVRKPDYARSAPE